MRELRACIYTNAGELKRMRQVLVNSIMATDIFDKDLKAFRESRWEKAFSEQETTVFRQGGIEESPRNHCYRAYYSSQRRVALYAALDRLPEVESQSF